jgi:hypothetical protein
MTIAMLLALIVTPNVESFMVLRIWVVAVGGDGYVG